MVLEPEALDRQPGQLVADAPDLASPGPSHWRCIAGWLRQHGRAGAVD